jgi:hypothetical protein
MCTTVGTRGDAIADLLTGTLSGTGLANGTFAATYRRRSGLVWSFDFYDTAPVSGTHSPGEIDIYPARQSHHLPSERLPEGYLGCVGYLHIHLPA